MLLFFRHGITPTANKLYQLVRKGSMSAPAEALTKFWETLREKSRIRIEHPDLPEPLREAAGEMVGALWQRAQAVAQEALVQLREEARAQVLAAEVLERVNLHRKDEHPVKRSPKPQNRLGVNPLSAE
ncbi:DNA-binding protein [Alicycliphilus denitrificans]|uniref:DNA-binding protein n=1 Tax=Alicycliphilus denitrificans TaxID=179636 RepID=UPI003850E6D8